MKHRNDMFSMPDLKDSENIDVYWAEMRKLAKTCTFGAFEDDLIRDRIDVGINNEDIRRKLLKNIDLTLEKCIDTIMAMEIAGQHMQVCRKGAKVERIGHYNEQHTNISKQENKCSRCGKQTPCCKCEMQ